MSLRLPTYLLPLLVCAACRSAPPAAVPVSGEAGSLSHLAGEWTGSYQSPSTGRSGSIVFTFVSGENHGHGDVVMVPSGGNMPLRPMPGQAPGVRDTTRSPQVLTIEFVRAAGDSISGTLATYEDPDCRCAASAVFRGRLDGNVMSGTFTTTLSQGARRAGGTWEVRRR